MTAPRTLDGPECQFGITETTFYRWKSKYGGMEPSDVKRLNALENENRKLKTSRRRRA